VVADGAAAIGYEDIKAYSGGTLNRAPMWVLFKLLEVIQGRSGPKEALADQIARSRAPRDQARCPHRWVISAVSSCQPPLSPLSPPTDPIAGPRVVASPP
jgi:hypothetical protein